MSHRLPASTHSSFLRSGAESSPRFPRATHTTRKPSSTMLDDTAMRTTRRVSQSASYFSILLVERQTDPGLSDRFCIKIPTTTAGVQAAAELYKEGIRTLGTSLFSLHQALGAAQGMMLSISPYFNGASSSPSPAKTLPADALIEVRAHVEQDLWPDVEDPATQHPFSYRMIHIRDAYAKLKAEGKHVPLNKAAS